MNDYPKTTATTKYTSIQNLGSKLSQIGIENKLTPIGGDGYRLTVLGIDDFDAVENKYSYGSEDDLIEIMGLLTPEEEKTDEVVGNLTADEVFARICQYFIDKSDEFCRIIFNDDNLAGENEEFWSCYYDQNFHYVAIKCDDWDDPVTKAFIKNAQIITEDDPLYDEIITYYMECDDTSIYFMDKKTKLVTQFKDCNWETNFEFLEHAYRADERR